MKIRSKSLLIIFSVTFLLLITCLFAYFVIKYTKVRVELVGETEIYLKVNNNYIEKGVRVVKGNNDIDDALYKTVAEGNVDYTTIGEYKVNYTVTYNNKEYLLERIIKVVDDEAPVITTNIETITKDYCTKEFVQKLTYEAIDNYDGNITDKIEKTIDEEYITLSINDASGNAEVKKISIINAEKPKNVLKLNGNSTVKISKGTEYKESGASYQDGCGNVIDTNIKISGNVDVNTVGDYTITYTHEKTGDVVTRKVTVYTPSSKTIYLTFDDGPGYYTQKVLDALDKYNVKATFFVTNQFPKYVHLIKTEAEKGHAVAVHTYTHNFNVYTSYETYINDFNLMNSVIENYTGSKTKLFRFPGGSSNTASRNYAKGIMTELVKKMTEDGYVYFDWNVSSADAGGANSSQIYSNVVSGVERCTNCIVLMHDIKSTTANAVEDILKTLTAKGYSFQVLTEKSPTARQRINN